MELVTEVQVHSEQSVEDEVQKTLRMIHRVMASNANKTNNNANSKTTTAPTTVTSTPTKTPTSTESKAKTKQTEAVATTITPMKDSSDNKEKGGKTPQEENNANKGHVSSANSIEQLLNDTVSHKKTTTSTTENSNKDIGTTATAATTDDKSDAVNSDMTSEHDEAEEGQSTASVGTPAGSSCKSACAMEKSTAQGEMTNTITIGEVKIKQEPVDDPAGGAAVVVGEEGGVVAGIPPNAILTEPGPSEVQDIRSMLPPVVPGLPTTGAPVIPSRGPGIRHRYTMVKSAPPPDTWVCEVCQSELASQKHLQTHKLCHFNTSHVCYACDTYFVHSDTLVMHMATLHRDLNPAGQSAIDDGLLCSVCLQRFSSQNNLAKHHNVHMLKDGKSCSCRVCGVDFPGARALMTHLGCSGHLAMKVKMQSVFVCVDCRCVFSSRDSYAMHMMMRAQDEVCKGASSSEGADIMLPSGHVAMTTQPTQVITNSVLSFKLLTLKFNNF